MFHPYKIEERPSVIPDVINYINKLCRSEMLDLIEKISVSMNDDDDSFGRSRMGCQGATSDHRGQWSWLAILISALIFQRRRLLS